MQPSWYTVQPFVYLVCFSHYPLMIQHWMQQTMYVALCQPCTNSDLHHLVEFNIPLLVLTLDYTLSLMFLSGKILLENPYSNLTKDRTKCYPEHRNISQLKLTDGKKLFQLIASNRHTFVLFNLPLLTVFQLFHPTHQPIPLLHPPLKLPVLAEMYNFPTVSPFNTLFILATHLRGSNVVNTIQLLLNYCIIIICHDLKFIITVLPTFSF